MGGGIREQQPGVLTQDFRRLEEDRANHPPRAWEGEGGVLGPSRPLGQRPLPARVIVGPVPWVSLKMG